MLLKIIALLSALIPLIQTGSFNLWHYRSPDLRTDIATPGYFNAAAGSLRPGDVMILQAADAMAILPVRSNALTGPGVTLDGAVAPVAMSTIDSPTREGPSGPPVTEARPLSVWIRRS